MKILTLSNFYPPDVMGGYELCCRQAVDALIARGHDVRVLTSAPRTPAASEPHVLRHLRLTDVWSQYCFRHSAPVTAHLTQTESHRINAYNVHALLAQLEEFQPDVVYLHLLVGLGGLGLLACLEHLRVPWVWQLGDNVPVRLCEAAGHPLIPLAREFNRQIEGSYIAVSRQLADAIGVGGIRLRGSVSLLPYWVDGPSPAPRDQYFQGNELRVVAAASVIDRQFDKGIELAIQAAGLLRSRGYDSFSLDIYGDVTDPYFPSLVLKLGVGDFVRFKGPLPQRELVQCYDAYDLFLFPTRPGEPFGVAPLEAAARGCVPLMSRSCGIAEWLVHGIHCLKAPRTASAFASTVASILDGVTELEPIGRRAAAVVRRDFHLDTIVLRIEEILNRASQRARAGAGTPAEAYRMALLAEKLSRILVQESVCA